MWSTNTLRRNVETLINKKSEDGYENYKFPKFALPLIGRLLSIVSEKDTKQTETEIEIPIDFENDDGK